MKSGTILIADDDRLLQLVLAEVLQGEWDLILAPDGLAALTALRRGGVDGVLLDLKMPMCGGIEFLLEAAKADLSMPPVIILTGALAADEPIAERLCEAFRVKRYLTKPVNFAQLQLACRCHFRRTA